MPEQPATAGRGAFEARVRGRVQGVGFRWWTRHEAVRLRLDGRVCNEPDGSVSVLAEGRPADLDRLAVLLKKGPPGARVDGLDLVRLPARGGPRGFTVE